MRRRAATAIEPGGAVRRAVEAIGSAVMGAAKAEWGAGGAYGAPGPEGEPRPGEPWAGAEPRALTHAVLAIAYRVVAAGTGALATWSDVARLVGTEGPLGALGIAAPSAPTTDTLDPDPLAHHLLTRPMPADAVAAFLAALAEVAPVPGDALGLAAAHQAILALDPTVDGGHLRLATPGGGRRAAGGFYTPDTLVAWLLDAALEPALAEADADGLAALRVCDPACGSGAFLVAAARRIRAGLHERGVPDAAARAVACLRGVDRDPLAVLLCRLGLWREGGGGDALAAHLVDAVRPGDALLGADAEALAAGIPDAVFATRPDRARLKLVRARNRAEQEGPRGGLFAEAANAWCAAFFWPEDAGPPPTTGVLRALTMAPETVPAPLRATVAALARDHGFFHWDLAFPDVAARGGFDVVLGNPPYLNQLERGTVASRPAAELLRARFGGLLRAYTDTATLFLLQGARHLRPGGRLGMVMPQSVLAAQDARGVRASLATFAPPTHVWWAGAHVFAGASVFVTALALRRPLAANAPLPPIQRAHGAAFAPLPPLSADPAVLAGDTWTPLVADALGAPALSLRPAGRLGDLAAATADFRDEYYGLLPFVRDLRDAEDAAFPPLVLTGHIDPATSAWGTRPGRFGKRAWEAPRIDLAALRAEGGLAAWAEARRVPKVLVATQTRVIEAVADPEGRWLTTTPTITVVPQPGELWRVAAVLLGPVASAWALTHYGAAALAVGAIKLSAGQVEAIPLPHDRAAWDEGAAHIAAAHAAAGDARRAHLLAAATAMVRAYGADPGLVTWWSARLPG